MHPLRTLRVGAVPYLVGRPLIDGLADEPGFELGFDVPALLVERLRRAELDVALVSSIELFRRPGYGYLAGSAIAGSGFVASVQVFLNKPVEALTTLALDPASRTAQALAQVMLARAARRDGRSPPRAFEPEAGATAEAAGADAWLSIGDPALARTLGPGAPPSFNPSAAWTETFALPFVFAAWVVRPGVSLDTAQVRAFARARERGTRPGALAALAAEGAAKWNLPLAACERYLALECRYDPGVDFAPALRRFRDEAAQLGLADGALEPAMQGD
ncbi:MAG TPA: MqnA/MqnD/SBP family protein [Planctomycetota bacterium]|nr:MqnA/MqnD/SBP family protein [Planctomycetota bacterium]